MGSARRAWVQAPPDYPRPRSAGTEANPTVRSRRGGSSREDLRGRGSTLVCGRAPDPRADRGSTRSRTPTRISARTATASSKTPTGNPAAPSSRPSVAAEPREARDEHRHVRDLERDEPPEPGEGEREPGEQPQAELRRVDLVRQQEEHQDREPERPSREARLSSRLEHPDDGDPPDEQPEGRHVDQPRVHARLARGAFARQVPEAVPVGQAGRVVAEELPPCRGARRARTGGSPRPTRRWPPTRAGSPVGFLPAEAAGDERDRPATAGRPWPRPRAPGAPPTSRPCDAGRRGCRPSRTRPRADPSSSSRRAQAWGRARSTGRDRRRAGRGRAR